ncbi:hypothetical protein, partial [Kaarinaea lacus]
DKGAEYILLTDLTSEPFTDAQNWTWYRGALQINLIDAHNRESKGTQRWEIKVSAQKQETAQQRVRDQVDTILERELRDTIIQFGIAAK